MISGVAAIVACCAGFYFLDAVQGDVRRIDPDSTVPPDVLADAGADVAWWIQHGGLRASAGGSRGGGFAATVSRGEGSQPTAADIEPFRKTVRPRAARGSLDYADACIGEDRFERRGELAGPISQEGPEFGDAIAEVHQQVAGLLSGPRPVRVRGR
ncbi:hypothetical protein, partial [Saccharopolyspora spinosa]|uniref:hypothetical protein n=1 Tax=Saccharopolyspora spinosa TaxID=60894 RepID=UPI00130539EA